MSSEHETGETADSRDVAEGRRFLRGLRFALLAVIPFWAIVAYLIYQYFR